MSKSITSSKRPASQTAVVPARQPETQKETGLSQCLIVSSNAARAEMLARAAADSGWETIVCNDAESALSCMSWMFLELAIVDFEGDAPAEFRGLTEKIAGTQGMLLMVCGNDSDAMEEIWARQTGAWLYLPGVQQSGDISPLCGEARTVADKLHAMTRQSRIQAAARNQRQAAHN